MKKHLSNFLLVLVFLLGACILLYPTVSDHWNSLHQTRVIGAYEDTLANMTQKDYTESFEAANAYNVALAKLNFPMAEYKSLKKRTELIPYEELLDVNGVGIMGYIDIDAIGVDASRYSLARTDYNSPVDIDLNLLASHSNDNPVYYVQYAHARSCNVDRNAEAAQINAADADLSLLDTEADGEVIAALAQWPALLTLAGDLRAPHRIAHYLEDLAAAYHKWYNVERVVPMPLTEAEERADEQTRERTRIAKNPEPARAAARLKLNDAVQTVIAEGLDLLGVTAPDKM